MKKFVQGLAVCMLMSQGLVSNGLAVYAAKSSETSAESVALPEETVTSNTAVETSETTEIQKNQESTVAEVVPAVTEKVQKVIDQIATVDLDNLTAQDQTKINQLIEQYNQLSNEEKAQVTNAQTLQAASEHLQKLVEQPKSTATNTITISVEKFVLGQGYVMEPMQVQVTTEMNYAQVLDEVFEQQGLQYSHTGSLDSDFYLKGITGADNGQTQIPQALIDFGDDYGIDLKTATNQEGNTLKEFSYTSMAGWMYSINNEFPGVGMSNKQVQDGDVFRIQFTLVGFGADLSEENGNTAFSIADKLALTKKIAEINQDAPAWQSQGAAYQAAYQFAMTQLTDLTASQNLVDQALASLENPETTPTNSVEAVKQLIQDLGEISSLTQKQQVQAARASYDSLTKEEQAQVGDQLVAQLVAAEKKISQLEDQAAASEVINLIAALPAVDQLQLSDQEKVTAAKEAYNTLTATQKKLVNNYDILQEAVKKMTTLQSTQDIVTALKNTAKNIEARGSLSEWSALAMSRSGYPASETLRQTTYKTLAQQILTVNGNYGNQTGQVPWTDAERQTIGILSLGGDPTNISGLNLMKLLVEKDLTGTINNQIFGLIALSTKDYQLKGQAEQIQKLVKSLRAAQLADGGWALYGDVGDIDISGMALTALAPYQDQKEVATTVAQGIAFLQKNLTADGDFYIASWYSKEPNANSQAQAIIGLAACGEDLTAKTYTTENGKNPITRLLEFQTNTGGFKWLLTDDTENNMATDQAVHGLSQFIFQQNNQGSIYDFTKNPVPALPIVGDTEAAQKVAELIAALPAAKEVTLEDQKQINNAASEYQLLPESAKKLLTAEMIQKLADCQERLHQLEKEQQAVEDVVASLDYMKLLDQMNMWSLSYQSFVVNTRQAYEALSDEQKAMIDPELVDLLNKAEKTMAQLQADEQTVKEISAGIKDLPEAEDLTVEDIKQASVVEEQYNALTDELKARIAPDLLTKWQAVSQRLDELKADLAKAQAVMDQIKELPEVTAVSLKDRGQIATVRKNYEALTKAQQAMVENYSILTAAEKRIDELMAQQASYTKVLQETNQYVLSLFTNYQPNFTNEWLVMDLARNGYDLNSPLFKTYYENVVNYIQSVKGQLHKVKYTEYSRLVLALTAMGKDAQEVGGYNLFDYLSDFKKVTYQGINGAIFALIAVDSREDYQFTKPAGVSESTTREKLIDFILQKELKDGGWNLFGNKISVDLTGMALQALAPYQNDTRVATATQRALTALSKEQNETGTFGDSTTENVEEVAQVITALTALGINPAEDQRFVKKYNLITALNSFQVAGSGFMHVLPGGNSNGGGAPGEVNGMATEQAMYALISYDRFLKDANSLYDMNDVPIEADQEAAGKVTEQIKALGTISSLDQRNAVVSARLAYEGLSQKQQSLIDQTVYNQLLQAEKTIAQLVAEEEEKQTQAENQAQAGKVILAISKLPEPALIGLQDEGQVALVRKAYNQLNHAAQSLVTNLDKLTAVEEALQRLKQADTVIVPKPVVDSPTTSNEKGTTPVIQVINGGASGTTLTTIGQSQQPLSILSANTQPGKAAVASKSATPETQTAEKERKATGWQFEGEAYEPTLAESQDKAETKTKAASPKVPMAVEVGGVIALGTVTAATGFWFWKKRA